MADSTRREFIQKTGVVAATLLTYPPARVIGANDRVRVGMIGVGARGQELLKQVLEIQNARLVAVADIYSRRRGEACVVDPGDEPETILALARDMGVRITRVVASHAHLDQPVCSPKDDKRRLGVPTR